MITEVSLDNYELTSPDATPTVTKVELVGVTPAPSGHGTIRLVRIEFVAYGGVPSGFLFDSPHARTESWAHRQYLPAHLHYVTRPTNDPRKGNTVWQLVVGLTVTGDGGFVRGARITYVSDGHTFDYTGADALGIVRTDEMCKHLPQS